MELTPRDRRMLLVLGVVAVLAAVVLFVFVLGGGEEVPPPPGGGGVSPGVSPTPTPTRTPALVAAGRDLFSIPPALAPTPSGTVSPSPSGTPSPSPSAPATPSHTTIGGHSVSLLDVYPLNGKDWVQVEVDGRVYTRSEGGSFDGGFTVTSVNTSTNCASFTHNGNPFTLCVSPQK